MILTANRHAQFHTVIPKGAAAPFLNDLTMSEIRNEVFGHVPSYAVRLMLDGVPIYHCRTLIGDDLNFEFSVTPVKKYPCRANANDRVQDLKRLAQLRQDHSYLATAEVVEVLP